MSGFTDIGISKIRLTGGEPAVRKDFTAIINAVSKISQVKKIAFTTNGYNLKKYAREWFDAGAAAVNISVDSLNCEHFQKITSHNKLDLVLKGIEEALKVGFKVKINAVLLKGINDSEIADFIAFVKDKNITLRFIELMQTGDNLEYFTKHHISSEIVKNYLLENGWTGEIRQSSARCDDGPAANYQHANSLGKIGIIAPYSKNFCDSCNRLRVTSKGDLRLCLFGDKSHSLRPLLQEISQKELLQDKIKELLHIKTPSHFLNAGNSGGLITNLSSLGG